MSPNNYLRLSHTISQSAPAFGNKDKICIRPSSAIKNGDTANTSLWMLPNSHYTDKVRIDGEEGAKLVPKSILTHIPYGPFNGSYVLIKRTEPIVL
jgi:hypothetical protein